jgi:DNA-binding transcriptional LysR family regulator
MDRIDDLNDMYYFAKVVDHGSYTAAAEATGTSTSALSRRISNLEKQLGVRLLNRSSRSISLSEAGHKFYQRCVAVVSEAFAAREDIDQARAEPFGLVRMTCPVYLVQNDVGEVVTRYLAAHPRVRIELEATNRKVDLVDEGIDVALRIRTPPHEDSELAVRELGATRRVLVGSRWLLAQHGRPHDLNALSKMPTLSGAHGSERHIWHFHTEAGETFSVSHMPRLISHEMALLTRAALEGIGLAYLPERCVRPHLDSGELVRLLPEYCQPQVLYAVFPSRRGMVPAVRGVLDALAEHYSGERRRERERRPALAA